MKSVLGIMTLFIISFALSTCKNEETYNTPELLMSDFFNELKNIKSLNQINSLLKFTPTQEELNYFFDYAEIEDLNMENFKLDLRVQVLNMGLILIYSDFYTDNSMLDSSDIELKTMLKAVIKSSIKTLEDNEKHKEKLEFLNTNWGQLDNVFQEVHSNLNGAKNFSFTRGSKSSIKGFPGDVIGRNYIHYRLKGEKKKIFIEAIAKFPNGWKIIVFDN